jgi:hypothetical protein
MSMQQPKNLWQELVDEAGEEEIERAASVSVEEAEAELAAAGFDVAAERAKASAFLDALESGTFEAAPQVREAEPAPPSPRRNRRSPRPVVMWLAAAATMTVAGGAVYAALHEHAPAPTPSPPPVESAVREPVAASELRRQAVAACDAQQWSECLALLDEARAADPDGDAKPAVKATRERAMRGVEGKLKP